MLIEFIAFVITTYTITLYYPSLNLLALSYLVIEEVLPFRLL